MLRQLSIGFVLSIFFFVEFSYTDALLSVLSRRNGREIVPNFSTRKIEDSLEALGPAETSCTSCEGLQMLPSRRSFISVMAIIGCSQLGVIRPAFASTYDKCYEDCLRECFEIVPNPKNKGYCLVNCASYCAEEEKKVEETTKN